MSGVLALAPSARPVISAAALTEAPWVPTLPRTVIRVYIERTANLADWPYPNQGMFLRSKKYLLSRRVGKDITLNSKKSETRDAK